MHSSEVRRAECVQGSLRLVAKGDPVSSLFRYTPYSNRLYVQHLYHAMTFLISFLFSDFASIWTAKVVGEIYCSVYCGTNFCNL